jgi:hypothetical protein
MSRAETEIPARRENTARAPGWLGYHYWTEAAPGPAEFAQAAKFLEDQDIIRASTWFGPVDRVLPVVR